jgi:hypothetical protein
MFDGKAVGTIDSIEKKKATVNYGVLLKSKSRSIRICGSREKKAKVIARNRSNRTNLGYKLSNLMYCFVPPNDKFK